MASLLDTSTNDAFDAEDEDFCDCGFYGIEYAKARELSRLVLPKRKELTDDEWQELTNSLWGYLFSKKFKDLIFGRGCKKLKACDENNREKDLYPRHRANA